MALAGFPIRSITVGEPVGELLVDDTWGNAQPKDADAGNLNLAGDIGAFASLRLADSPFALVMGIAGVPVDRRRDRTRTYAEAGRIQSDQLVATLATGYHHAVLTNFPSLKFGGFTIRQVVGQPAEMTFNVIANTKRYSTDTTDLPTNVAPFPSLVTTISPRYRLMGHHCTVRV